MEDEKILYKNETIYKKESLQNFSKFIWMQYNRFISLTIIIISTLYLIFNIVGVIGEAIRFQKMPNVSTLVFILIHGLIIIVMIKIAKGNVKIKENIKDIVYKYDFFNNYLFISTELASQKILFTDLSNIQNVCNTEKYIYIMVNKISGYIIDKSGFNNYNEQEFENYLIDKFKNKYINYLDNKKKKSYTIKFIIISIIILMFLFVIISDFIC